ncbi:hypothetical protein TTHT_0971 [Thermotomaculum hydrothermale]|uniref:Protein kinase domain-containing protein n=1 Tax=Thermotomaculum hydrothermale TaxID=981385 RepID=A0A7R6PF12_9BACT|nr:energy transducer TonB [Thermotomaculum hydrothermale]BBB32523.1 hypothetical protein TTHT_0971 [Thermotomaculum hydrothermale]
MAELQVLDNYIVSEKIKEDGFSEVFRGISTSDEGQFKEFVFIKKFKPEPQNFSRFVSQVVNYSKTIKTFNDPLVAKTLDAKKTNEGGYIVCEFVEGQFLNNIINKSREEGFPFSIDHVLLIASKLSAALSSIYSKGFKHGFVTPYSINISFEGDVKLYDLAIGPYIVEYLNANPDFKKDYISYIHPDVFNSGKGNEQYDIFSVGAITYQLLTGKPLIEEDGVLPDIKTKLNEATLASSSFGDDPLPDDIKEVLYKCLTGGYSSIKELGEVLDNLIFSGDYSPTTFNLAFFMHSLYRDVSEELAKTLELERSANYAGYFGETRVIEKKMSPVIIAAIVFIIIAIGAVGGYYYWQSKEKEKRLMAERKRIEEEIQKKKLLEMQKQKEIEELKKQMELRMQEALKEAEKMADQKAKEFLKKKMEEEKQKQLAELQRIEAEKKRIEEERRRKEMLLKQKQLAEQKKQQDQQAKMRELLELQKKKEEEARRKKLEEAKKKEELRKKLYGTVVAVEQLDSAPRPVYKEKIILSPSWRLPRGAKVLVMVLIGVDGSVDEVKLIRKIKPATPHSRLAEKRIVSAVKKWKFTPPMKEGVPVKTWIPITIPVR